MAPSHFTEEAVLEWAAKLRKTYSPTRFKGAMQTLRGILHVAVDRGLLHDNPAKSRKRNSSDGVPNEHVPPNSPKLPEADRFHALLAALESVPPRKKSSWFVRFLAYGGARIDAARQVTPKDIDLRNNLIRIPHLKKEDEPTLLPMIPEMLRLVEDMHREYPGTGPLLPIQSPRRALTTACKDVGIEPHLTPHDLRHLFATHCMESGVDVKTVASWLGHKDGGRLLLERHTHLRNEHSQEMAKKIRFGNEPEVALDSDI